MKVRGSGNYDTACSLDNNRHGGKVANLATPFSPLHHKSVVTNISNYFSPSYLIINNAYLSLFY